MKKLIITILFIIYNVHAGSNDLQPFRYLAHPLDATFNIANLVSTDAPRPMDNAIKGNWKFSFAPSWFKVDQAYKTTAGNGGGALVRGDDLNGFALSSAMGYGLTDRWQIFGLATYVSMDGKMFGRIPGNAANDQYVVEGENQVMVGNVGFGYDLLEKGEGWHIPMFFGLFMKYYNTDMTNSPLPGDPNPYTTITGNGMLYGLSFGVQFTRIYFEKLKLSPYIFVGQSFSGPEVTVKVTNSNGNSQFPVGTTITDKLDNYPFPVPGLTVGWVPWGLDLSVSGPLISYFSKTIYEGLDLTRYSLTFNFPL